MACRSVERGNAAAQDILQNNPSLNKNQLIVMNLDLGSIKSIRSFVTEFKKSNINCCLSRIELIS